MCFFFFFFTGSQMGIDRTRLYLMANKFIWILYNRTRISSFVVVSRMVGQHPMGKRTTSPRLIPLAFKNWRTTRSEHEATANCIQSDQKSRRVPKGSPRDQIYPRYIYRNSNLNSNISSRLSLFFIFIFRDTHEICEASFFVSKMGEPFPTSADVEFIIWIHYQCFSLQIQIR